ncbi:FIVAR domain-containing protein [Clostridium facile]|uniref:FIVAR domain-containing protein n=1 Tax=Clostridium facile TaxID=2763035 RepID=A0ABR7ISM0_9CLOT|nr:FIVAR domain-containing protein [Clostridium facile]MBC5788140.1 FIVAR domain-containing protein [Clostridium facile]
MKRTKLLAAVLATAMVVTSVATALPAGATDQTASGSVISAFQNPSYTQKPMARMWFPDGGAGIDEYDTVEKQIMELAEAGFGGVEVTMLSSSSNIASEDAKVVGWGTEAWNNTLKKVLKAAKKVEGGFIVDITITAHWPTTINNIDPNDDAASQEITSTVTKVTADDLQSNSYKLTLPEQKTQDRVEALKPGVFLFTDTLVSSSLVKVDSVKEDGTVIYDLDSIIDLNTSTTGDGYAAGVPDEATFNEYQADGRVDASMNYQNNVLNIFGEAPAEDADFSQSFNKKIDENGNRKRMADWQNYYQADLSATNISGYTSSEGDAIQAGDYVVVTTYRRGTGQIMSDAPFGGISDAMYARSYVTNYFNRDGVDAIFDYWNKSILNDEELVSLLKENGSSIFEDSIEASHTGAFWSYNLMEELEQENYQYTDEFPIVMALGTNSFNDTSLSEKISQDYNNLLGELYETVHAAPISEWASTFNYTYRAQPYSLPGLDIAGASATLDIPEGDNGTKGDGLRNLSAAVNLADKTYLSMEAVTGFGNLQINWADVATEVTQNFSGGVNHLILHGTPYSKSYNGYNASWPGWMAFGNNFCGSYSYRQPYWEDMDTLANYMARNQAILQTGEAKVDLAILNDKLTTFSNAHGNNFQELLDNGYSYNIMSEALLDLDNATVKDGVIYPEGPGYKALVLNEVSTISTDAMQTILEYAQAGLPIILYNSQPTQVYGTGTATNNDKAMLALFDQLKTYNNVKIASTEAEILSLLEEMSVSSYASYTESQLETSHYVDATDASNYYFLYNNPVQQNSGMIDDGENEKYKSGKKVDTDVTLTGDGIPYMLDAWTGEITPIADYTVNGDGTITTHINLSGGESTWIAITNDTTNFPEVQDVHAVSKTGGTVQYNKDGEITLRSNETGTYETTLSDGSTKSTTINNHFEDIDLSGEGWSLELQSWGPDKSTDNIQDEMIPGVEPTYPLYKDPSKSVVTTVNFDNVALGDWKDLPVTEEQLQQLGVASMQNVIGIGYYTKKFNLPENWTSENGATMKFAYNHDQVTEISINGMTIPDIDNITDTVDLGGYLKAGENEITIKLATSMFNRAVVENMAYTPEGGMPQMNGTDPISLGLTSVILSPYTEVVISATPQETADKGILNSIIEYADAAKASGEYDNAIESVQKSFDEALTNAKAVAENDAATQEEVDAAWKTLLNEIHKLGFVAGDKTELASLIAAAEGIDLSKYVEAGQAEFTTALEAAQSVYKDGDAMQAEINEVADKLLNAMLNLRYKADKSILEEVVAKANQIDANVYTAKSYAVLEAALKDANAVLANENATQEEVDVAVQSVQAAMDSLVAVEGTETETPTTNNNATQTGQESTTTKANAAKTGDIAPIAGMAVLAVAGAAILITRKKK